MRILIDTWHCVMVKWIIYQLAWYPLPMKPNTTRWQVTIVTAIVFKYTSQMMASHVEKLSKMAYQEKQKNLKAFRRQVQKRVSSREREKKLEMQLHSRDAVCYNRISCISKLCGQVTAEHCVIQRGRFMMPKGAGDIHTQRPPDVEDVCITASTGNAVDVHQVQQDLQLARKKLAAKKKDVDMVLKIIIILTYINY